MHLHSRIKIIALALLASSAVYGTQVFTLEGSNDYIFKESEDHILENGMYLYHHYYQRTCDLKLIDFTLAPLYRYNRVIDTAITTDTTVLDKKVSNNLYGGFAQAVLNLGDLWIRTDTVFGRINERFNSKEGVSYPSEVRERSFSGFDDIVIRAGYDFFNNGDDHWGPYILGSIPVNHEVEAQVHGFLKSNWRDQLKPIDKKDEKGNPITKQVAFVDLLNNDEPMILDIETPQMGVGNYRVGGGLQGAWTVYDNNEHHIALFADVQYSYALSTSLARIAYNEMLLTDGTSLKDLVPEVKKTLKDAKTVQLINPQDRTEIKYTAGSLINILGIMHYACGDFNLEYGCLLSAGFGQKLQRGYRVVAAADETAKLYPDDKKQAKSEEKSEDISRKGSTINLLVDEVAFTLQNQPEIVNFRIQPYVALGINTLISDNPFTVGIGLGYEYDHTSSKNAPNSLQGLSAWTTLSLSF